MKINKINGRYVLSNNGEYLASADKVSALELPAVYGAAPELLDALKQIVADVYCGMPIKMDDSHMLNALDVIAKAKG